MPPASDQFTIRVASDADVSALKHLVERSVRALAPGHYDDGAIESSLRYLYGIDTQLVADRTYYVVEHDGLPVACGGWSFRLTPFGSDDAGEVRDDARRVAGRDAAVIRAFFVHPEWTRRGLGRLVLEACEDAARDAGFDRFELTATLMGIPFYRAAGYRDVRPVDVTLADGVVLPHLLMEKP